MAGTEKKTLTGRERLLRTLRGEPVDRMPVAPFVYYNAVYEMFGYRPSIDHFYDPPDFDPIEKFVEYCDHFGFDVLHVPGGVWDMYVHSSLRDRSILESDENWDVTWTDEGDDDQRRRTITIHTPGGILRQVESYKRTSTYLIVQNIDEHLVKTRRDFELLRDYAPPADKMDCSLITRARRAVGDKGLVDNCTNGAFNILGMFRKVEQVLMDPLTDEGFYREMVEFFLPRLICRAKKMVEAGTDLIEIGGHYCGSNVGPDFYRKCVLEYEKRLVQALRDAGAYVLLHNCGTARTVMHLYNELPIHCWGYLTPPPFGDVELDEALRVIRPDMALRGNIDQVEFLVKASPAEVRERVKQVVLKAKERGHFILSTTDFFFDGTPYENIKAFAEAGREFGSYQ
ncbi:MAG: hypothetical protein JW818_16415 [Pirellulales bacterium]|nr:hypothetical protein [Pirellulales bacterium]